MKQKLPTNTAEYRSWHRDYVKRPRMAFGRQRRAAKARGIEWLLTFEEWWHIWEESGAWAKRGIRHGEYCMSRCGDQGPYSTTNVFIQTHAGNASEVRKRSSLPPNVFAIPGRTSHPFRARIRINGEMRDLGTFTTIADALAALERLLAG